MEVLELLDYIRHSTKWVFFSRTYYVVVAGLLLYRLLGTLCRLYYFFALVHTPMRLNLKRKTFVITGASSGLGYETTSQLYARGATVFMVVRDVPKAEKAIEKIKEEFKLNDHKRNIHKSGSLHIVCADLTDDHSIREAAHLILQSSDKVDVLVNNAGIGSQKKLQRVGPNDAEFIMQSNFYGHLFLTMLLLPSIAQCNGRVVNVTSLMYKHWNFSLDDVNFDRRPYSGLAAYANSKCALIMMNRHLSVLFPELQFYSVDPGIVATPIGDHFVDHAFGPLAGIVRPLARLVYAQIGKTPAQGCQTILMLCTAPIAPQMNGELFENGRVAKEQSSFVRDPASCAKLFERTSTRIYSGQREFNCDRVVHFDQESYSRLLNVCNEARSDDDSLSVCETDVTLPDSASLCERKPSFSTSSTTHSFFGDPRDEEDRDALEMSNASLAVQTGNYDTSVEFNLEDFEHGNMRRYRRGSQTTPSLTSSEYSESDSSNEPGCRKRRKVPYSPVFEFEVENDKDRDQFSFDDYYLKNEDDGNWTMSKEPIGEKTAARKTQEKDRSSLARKFPKKFPYDSDASKTDAKSDCSSLREGRFMTDEEIYVGLKEFKSSKLNVVSKPSIQRKDPFADFSIDEQAYQGTSNPNSRKVVDKNWYSEIEYAGSEDCNPNGEDTSGAIRLSKKEKKKRKWRNPVKNLFRRASKKVTG